MSDERRPRSRFDQVEPARRSRFDRRSQDRSRSPVNRRNEDFRERSPARARPQSQDESTDALAEVNKNIEARRHDNNISNATASGGQSSGLSDDIVEQDGDFIKDIEINDLRNRYTLTKGDVQKMINDETGADVTTRGEYYPNKAMAIPSRPPLHLHITARSKESLLKAIGKIDELMSKELPNLIDERRFRRREPREEVERDEYGRRKWPEARIPIDLEPVVGFNLRAQIVGGGGAFVKHIQSESNCRVQIKGRGSGFTERDTGMEGTDPMYLHVTAPRDDEVQHGVELCNDLLTKVRSEYHEFKARGSRHRGGYGNNGHNGGGYGRDRRENHDQHRDYNAGGANGNQDAYAYQNQYSQQGYGAAATGQDGDPYAAWGGYEAYCRAWYDWQAQGGQQGQAPDAGQGASSGQDAGAQQYGQYAQQYAQQYGQQDANASAQYWQQADGAAGAPGTAGYATGAPGTEPGASDGQPGLGMPPPRPASARAPGT